MVDTKEYNDTAKQYVNVVLVESFPLDQRRAVIMPGAVYAEYTSKTQEQVKKLVLKLSLNKQPVYLGVSAQQSKEWGAFLGTTDTDKWVGAVIQLGVVAGGKNGKYVSASIVEKPQGGV
jgi:hypothetical protein